MSDTAAAIAGSDRPYTRREFVLRALAGAGLAFVALFPLALVARVTNLWWISPAVLIAGGIWMVTNRRLRPFGVGTLIVAAAVALAVLWVLLVVSRSSFYCC